MLHICNMEYEVRKKVFIPILLMLLTFFNCSNVLAQESSSVLYVPLIGLTSVPEPLALPDGAGNVTYHYALKNFLEEVALTNIHVVDDTCNPITFVEGDDNNDSKLDYSETWRYICTIKLSQTTQSTATATGIANNINTTDKSYATVIVGSNNPPPLISIINITKVAYPLSLPKEGGKITFTYKVNNPGVVPLADVIVTDNKCSAMSGRLGDTNGNNLLDINEVWIYTCAMILKETTTNTVNVTAFSNGLKAADEYTITVNVAQSSPNFPDTGVSPNLKITVWAILAGILVLLLTTFFGLTRKSKLKRGKK